LPRKNFYLKNNVIRNFIFIAFYIFFFSSFAKGNSHCNWTSNKAGITIHYTSSCDKKNQSALDDVLNKVLTLLNGRDTSLKILVFINEAQLSFNNNGSLNFSSIAYDTLRAIDDGYILQYYTDQETISTKQTTGSIHLIRGNIQSILTQQMTAQPTTSVSKLFMTRMNRFGRR